MAQSHLGPHGATEHALRTLGGAVSFLGWTRLLHYGVAQRTPDAGLRAQAYCQLHLALAQSITLRHHAGK